MLAAAVGPAPIVCALEIFVGINVEGGTGTDLMRANKPKVFCGGNLERGESRDIEPVPQAFMFLPS